MKIINLIKSIYYKLISANKYAEIVGVKMGKNCKLRTKYFGSEPYLITLGNNVGTSGNVQFITHDGSVHVLRNLYEECKDIDLIKPIKIGDNVFIGVNSVILPGTTIGNNIIIGAGSIVKGYLEDNSVYAGVPAKFICTIDDYKDKNKQNFSQTRRLSEIKKRKYFDRLENN